MWPKPGKLLCDLPLLNRPNELCIIYDSNIHDVMKSLDSEINKLDIHGELCAYNEFM